MLSKIKIIILSIMLCSTAFGKEETVISAADLKYLTTVISNVERY